MEQAQKKHEYHDGDVLLGSLSSSSTSSCVSGISIGSSLESDSFEEVSSPAASSSSSSSLSSTEVQRGVVDDPLNDMSSLFQQLPIKRGLSKFYEGKSQSFTSLTNVRSLEDLAKAEKPYKKRLKSWKSYGGGLSERSYRGICKRGIIGATRVSCSSLSARKGRGSFMGSRPPIPPHRPTNTNTNTNTKAIPNQTVLFA